MKCEVTNNPCGTDTWEDGYECPCLECTKWLNEQLVDQIFPKGRIGQMRHDLHVGKEFLPTDNAPHWMPFQWKMLYRKGVEYV